MIARCTTREKDGRMIFYGAMCVESVVALIWATAGLTFYGDTGGLTDALAAGGSAGVVYEISMSVAGPIGGILAIIGVIICPITSGDTAMRSARLMIQDDRQIHSDNVKATLSLTIILSFFIVGLCLLDFSILWQYFSWLNQTLACIVLWTATVFLLRTNANRMYSLITALPAIFMTMTVTSFIMHSGQGFSLDYTVSLMIAAFVTVAATVLYVREYASKKTENQE
jgi:carbon starvation protein CstA